MREESFEVTVVFDIDTDTDRIENPQELEVDARIWTGLQMKDTQGIAEKAEDGCYKMELLFYRTNSLSYRAFGPLMLISLTEGFHVGYVN